MAKKKKQKMHARHEPTFEDLGRRAARRQLKQGLREEREIMSLARALTTAMQKRNDCLQKLATVLSSHARAMEAERDVDRSLADDRGSK
jgi:hypothetical protein